MIYNCLNKWLLYVFRVPDTNFFTSPFGMKSDGFVGKYGKTNHSLVTDNLDAIFAGGVVCDESPRTTTY